MPQTAKRVLITTFILVGAWWILSGRFDLLHFGSGVVIALAVAANFTGWEDGTRFRPVRFFLYVPWLMGQIFLSNVRVARAVLSPRLAIAPTFQNARPGVTGDRALTTLGASTTLTPGTLTIEVSPDDIFIHALDVRSASDFREGIMARRVARVFEEPGA
jgi:multicomponent Na+:H+ antiporter subunit E